MPKQLEKLLKGALLEYGTGLVEQLAEKYGFDRKEALLALDLEVVAEEPRKPKGTKAKPEPRMLPSIPLPFCGQHQPDWCNGIRLNHGLHTQCTQLPGENGLCKTCAGQGAKNGTGKPTYGLISERVARYDEQDVRNWRTPAGTLATPYTKVMEKVGITREEAEKEAAKFGWAIPEQHFTVSVGKAGRPKKSTATSDTDSDSDAESKKKKRGRPKKEKKVVNTNLGDDLIATLLAQAAVPPAEPKAEVEDEIVHVPTAQKRKPRRDAKHKLVVPQTPEVEAKVEAAEALKEELEAAEADTPLGDADTPLVVAAFGKDPLDAAFEAKYAVEDHDEEDDEEEVAVSKFEFDGRTYLRAPDNVLYDVETQEEVGVWDESEGRVQALPSGDWD